MLLKVLYQAVSVQSIGHLSVEVEVDAGLVAVSGHQGDVLVHHVLGVVVFRFLIPWVRSKAAYGVDRLLASGTHHSYLSSPSLLASG